MDEDRVVRIAVAFARQDASAPAARLCSACVEVLHVSGAGVTLMSGMNSGPVCSSSDQMSIAEDLQFTLGEGPCQDAFRSGEPVLEPQLEARTRRWPNFSPPVLDLGIRSVFAFPLAVGTSRIGVLTLYNDAVGTLTDEQAADSLVVADVIAQTMLAIQTKSEPNRLADELTDASAHRAEVHEASGMVAIQLGVGVTDALARIRAHAFAAGQTVVAVADDIVSRRLRLVDDRKIEGTEADS